MSYIRALFKLISFLIATLFYYSLIMICLFGSIVGVNYEKCRGYLLRTWGRTCCSIMGIELEVKNTPPEPPFLLVSNHLSYLDVFVLFAQLRCLFVAKNDVKTWPLIGFIIRTSGILFIDRHRKRDVTRVNKLISNSINQNQGIILFAEGTTSPGMDILPFRASLLQYPAAHNFEVSHAAVSYTTPSESTPAYRAICWWDDTPFLAHFFNFLKLKECTAKITFGRNKISETDRKELAVRLQEAVGQEFEPVISKKAFNEKHGVFEPILPL